MHNIIMRSSVVWSCGDILVPLFGIELRPNFAYGISVRKFFLSFTLRPYTRTGTEVELRICSCVGMIS